ncbi:uncharacterized protein LOC144672809 [Cetorhinus maximus]
MFGKRNKKPEGQAEAVAVPGWQGPWHSVAACLRNGGGRPENWEAEGVGTTPGSLLSTLEKIPVPSRNPLPGIQRRMWACAAACKQQSDRRQKLEAEIATLKHEQGLSNGDASVLRQEIIKLKAEITALTELAGRAITYLSSSKRKSERKRPRSVNPTQIRAFVAQLNNGAGWDIDRWDGNIWGDSDDQYEDELPPQVRANPVVRRKQVQRRPPVRFEVLLDDEGNPQRNERGEPIHHEIPQLQPPPEFSELTEDFTTEEVLYITQRTRRNPGEPIELWLVRLLEEGGQQVQVDFQDAPKFGGLAKDAAIDPKRQRRAWYDTLLGGAGTVMGISNAIDSEVTRTKLSSAGQATAQGLYTIGRWMPSAMMTQKETARILLHSLKWELDVWDSTQQLFQNFTVQLNWTFCGIQMLHAHLQKERFLRIVTSPNVQAWREVWNVSERLWMNTYPDKTWCNATLCKGHFVTLNVTDFVTVCRYYVLPVITSNGYCFLKTKGDWFSPDTNLTYDLSACEQADQGKACLLMDRYRDPCLTEDTALCEWMIEAPRDMMWQIGPHTLCVATSHANALLPTTPFSGCLTGIYQWRWQNHTYLLTNHSETQHLTTMQWQVLLHPWSISLERFKQALDRSEELKQILQQHQINVTRVTVSTFIHGQRVVHAARVVEVESAHHWWDLLNGLSTTARRSLFPPLFIIIGILVILTCCNILTCMYVCHVRRQLEQNMYML